ncbi:hypothetical protein [uncultured Zoogloea sp.]|uniref:hypothetical protein n=1 Tax=uncultured Zoogloea sp. TaxID=160237 RepID=UPI00261D04A0|nr:hypothetical protein [uncultured Zoogloea sp.]
MRDALLLRWLGPKVEGDKEAGRFAGRPTRELAKAFNRRFRTELSERTVLRYIHQAVARATRRAEAATRHAALVGRVGVFVPPPEVALPTRGRPKSGGSPKPRAPRKKPAPVSALPTLINLPLAADAPAARRPPREREPAPVQPLTAVPTFKPPRARPGPKPRFKRWSRVWWELQALTGWSARMLYHHLQRFPGIQPLLGSRASFLQGLADLDAPRPTWDPVAATQALPVAPEEAFIEDLRSCGVLHVLHLHQVLLNTEKGEWAVLLLAFDPQSLFVNVQVLDFEAPPGRRSAGSPLGRPRRKCHAEWLATVKEEGDAIEVQVSPDAYRDFVIDTIAKTGIPYSPVWLSLGVAVPDHVVDALTQHAPDDAFVVSPVPDWPRGPLVVPTSLKTLCGQLADLVNAHNRAFAQPRLRKVRALIEALKEKGRVTPSTLAWLEDNGLYDVKMDHVMTLGLQHPPRQDVRHFAVLSAFEAGYPGLSSRGHYVALKPLRIRSQFVDEGES